MAILQHILLLSLFILTETALGQNDERPLLTTKYGQLRGVRVTVKETSRAIDVFYRIPFGKPPVGPLRFANPEPPVPWSSVRDASEFPPMCIQDAEFSKSIAAFYQNSVQLPPISEDCLYLNVYAPADRDQKSKLPVMVYIHGGGLVFGLASMYDGSALSAYEDVVYVAIQYRVGILGFMSTGDGQLPGNYGFMDQVAALRWIQENIESFGGDPECVTIFGESAGGISTTALMLSPLAKGLFHRAIAESGSVLIPTLIVSSPEELIPYQQRVASISGCDLASIADCLKQKSEEEFLTMAKAMGVIAIPGCVDGAFLPKPAEEIFANKEGNKVPLLIGVNNQEFGWIIPTLYGLQVKAEGMTREEVIQALQNIPLLGLSPDVIPLIVDEYLGDTTDPLEIRDHFLDICGDIMFVIPALKTAKYLRDMGLPVYFYEFQHLPTLLAQITPDYVRADHTSELPFVFGGPFLGADSFLAGPATPEEIVLSKKVMNYWANMARTGNPNGPGLTTWLPFGTKEYYLEINLEQELSSNLKADKYKFWTETLPARNLKQRVEVIKTEVERRQKSIIIQKPLICSVLN